MLHPAEKHILNVVLSQDKSLPREGWEMDSAYMYQNRGYWQFVNKAEKIMIVTTTGENGICLDSLNWWLPGLGTIDNIKRY